ncbi:MAG: phage tail tape measure protein, partial [Endozoicomonadaceae bacterium]|nr:phage tail tape measure protein [Endozoicomonadaceae bacterium]
MLNSLLFLLFLNFFMINSHANVAFPLSHHKLHEVQQDLILKAFNDLKSKSQLSEKETEKLEIYSLTQNLIENVKIEEANLKSFSEKKINEQKRIKQLTLELSKLTFLPEKYQKLNETVDVNTLNKTQETLNAVQIRLQSQSVKLNHQMADIHVIKDDNDKKLAVNQKRLEYLKKQLEQLRLDATISLSEQKRLYITSEMWFIDINNQV